MARFRLLIEYDGSAYAGWQIQQNAPTVQGEIENALAIILKENIKITGAGRTGAGVHARGQVAHFDTEKLLENRRLQRSLNGILKQDIRIKQVTESDSGFHARYSARSRIYHYTIARRPVALLRGFAWFFPAELDLAPMSAAAAALLGSHDFKSFCRTLSSVPNHDCTILRAQWQEQGEDFLVFIIEANRFLHGMVRAIVGTLIDIGRGCLTVDDIYTILEKKERSAAGEAAPPRGLVLHKVIY